MSTFWKILNKRESDCKTIEDYKWAVKQTLLELSVSRYAASIFQDGIVECFGEDRFEQFLMLPRVQVSVEDIEQFYDQASKLFCEFSAEEYPISANEGLSIEDRLREKAHFCQSRIEWESLYEDCCKALYDVISEAVSIEKTAKDYFGYAIYERCKWGLTEDEKNEIEHMIENGDVYYTQRTCPVHQT